MPCLRVRSTRSWLFLDNWQPVSDEEFGRRLAEAPEEGVDEETTARVLAAEAERGENISHEELVQRLSL